MFILLHLVKIEEWKIINTLVVSLIALQSNILNYNRECWVFVSFYLAKS